jgi:hypothetical protein
MEEGHILFIGHQYFKTTLSAKASNSGSFCMSVALRAIAVAMIQLSLACSILLAAYPPKSCAYRRN